MKKKFWNKLILNDVKEERRRSQQIYSEGHIKTQLKTEEDNDANLKNKQYFKSKTDENIIKVRIQNVLTATSDNQNKLKIRNHQTRQLRKLGK